MSSSGVQVDGTMSTAMCNEQSAAEVAAKCDVPTPKAPSPSASTPTPSTSLSAAPFKRDCEQSAPACESNNNNVLLASTSTCNSLACTDDALHATCNSTVSMTTGTVPATAATWRSSTVSCDGPDSGSPCDQCTELRETRSSASPKRQDDAGAGTRHLCVRDRRSGSSQDGGPSPSPSASLGTTPSSTPEPPRRPSAPASAPSAVVMRGLSESDSTPSGSGPGPRRERASVPAATRSSVNVRPPVTSHKLSLLQTRSHSHERELVSAMNELATDGTDADADADADSTAELDQLSDSPLKRTQSVMSTPSSVQPPTSNTSATAAGTGTGTGTGGTGSGTGGGGGGGGVSPSSSGGTTVACACAATNAHSQLHERVGKKPSAAQAPEDNASYELCKRLETLVTRMFDESTGVPVRTVKNFISKIPSVFTGADLVAWISKNVNVADPAEALHLACMLAAHGYLFPVDDHVLTVKPDNTYYRFQTPCLWPSRCDPPENVDYAVYLCKRTMQSRPRNELMDYEAESLARLQKTLNRKWELIYMQAEAQAKVDRKRDKQQREVLDSQERAFWDLHRPVPNAVSTMEVDMRKALRKYKPSARLRDPIAAFVNTNVSEQQVFKDARDRVYRLTKLLDRHRIKVSKVAETLISRGDQYAPFDALITQPDPSNPWVTDNQEYWETEKCRTDVALRRVQKWSFSLLELIKDPAGHEQFEKFLEREFSKENLKFWEACVRLKYAPVREISERMRAIYVQFLAPGAAEAVNVDSKIQETVNKKLSVLYSDRYVFEEAEDHIFQLMNRDSYSRFLRSEQYKDMLRTAKPPRNVALAGKRKTTEAAATSAGAVAGQQQASGGATGGVSSGAAGAAASAGKSLLHATKSSALGDQKDANKDASSV